MITFVKLKNWKSHRETELRFGDGTNVLIGMMGAGKSSVMDGITYALFGTLPAIQSRRIKLDDLITSRPKPMDRAEVEVGFLNMDGDEFTVKRVIGRGSGTTLSEVRKSSGELMEGPNSSRVTELIRSLLDLDYDLFERAIYSEQNRLDYFLTLPRGKRMESIDELLGINKLEKARKGVGSLSNRLTDRASEREIAADNLRKDPSIPALPAQIQELQGLENSKRETWAKLQQLQPELESIRAQDQQFRKVERDIAALQQSRRELEGTIAALNRSIELLKQRLGASAGSSIDDIQSELNGMEQAHSEKVSKLDMLGSDFTSVTSKLQSLETRKSILSDNLGKISAQIERKRKLRAELEKSRPDELSTSMGRLQGELRQAEDELAGHRARIQDLKLAIENLLSAGASCPVCESPLDESRKAALMNQRREELDALKGRAEGADSLSKRLSEELGQVQEKHRKAILLEKEVEDLPKIEADSSELSRQLSEIEVESPSLREKSEKLAADVEISKREADEMRDRISVLRQKLQNRTDLDSRSMELKLKLEESARVKQGLDQMGETYDEAKVESVRRRLEELVGTQERLRAEFQGKEQLITEKKKLVESIKEKIGLISRYDAEVNHLREAAQALSTIQTALARTQTAMRKMFIEGVNLVMGELWESIYPYGDFVGIQLAVEEGERGDYVLQLRDRAGNWIPVDGIASGGERTDAALALRISFSTVLAPKLKWIVFDEPTHNLDSEGIQELAKVMRERLPEVVRQILLITHEEKLEAAVSGYLYRFYRDKGADEPTRVEQASSPELY